MSLRLLTIASIWLTTFSLAIAHAAPPIADIDDRGVHSAFQRAMVEQMDSGETISAADLSEQLDRTGPAAIELVAPSSQRLTPPQVYDRAQRSVVLIGSLYKCENCDQWHAGLGSGFAIAPSVVVTNYHVVQSRNGTPLGVHTIDGKTYYVAEVLAADAKEDLAILRVDTDKLSAIAVGHDAPIGADVFVLSHPVNRFFTFTRGMISRYMLSHESAVQHGDSEKNGGSKAPGPRVRRVALTANYSKGSSGAPLIDDHGAVVGVACRRTQVAARDSKGPDKTVGTMNFHSCIPVSALRRLITPTGHDTATAAPSASGATTGADTGENAGP